MNKEERKETIKLPQEFRKRMQQLMGEEASEFFHSYEEERSFGIRYNPLKFSSADEFETKLSQVADWNLSPVPWCKEGYYYKQENQPGKHPWHEAGAYYIQEPSAMSAAELLGAKPFEKICDLCAAPGGKTTQIAGKMQGHGLLVSNEYYSSRAKILSQNVERLGIGNAVVLNESTGHLAQKFPGFFDRVLIDAPCSGEGMFRKEPKALQEWSLENVELSAKRQTEILNHGADMLKPGGVLVYSTCTFSPLENEQRMACFLENHPEFSLERVELGDKYFSFGRPEWARSQSSNCFPKECLEELSYTYRLWPHKLRGEGHFAARLVKAGGCHTAFDGQSGGTKKTRHKAKKNGETLKIEAAVSEFQKFQTETLCIELEEMLPGNYHLFGEQLYLVPEDMPGLSGLKVLRAGLHLGALRKHRFEPSHELARYLLPGQVRQTLTCSEPMKYLHGETISCDSKKKGWVLVCADGLSLGWGKAHKEVVKNHYPKGLRL